MEEKIRYFLKFLAVVLTQYFGGSKDLPMSRVYLSTEFVAVDHFSFLRFVCNFGYVL